MENLDVYLESGVVQQIINCPLITYLVKEIDYTKDKLSEVQKMLLEVYLPLIILKNLVEAKTGSVIDSILQITPGISEAKRSLRIIKEQTNYSFLKYFVH
jgi:hypothetical protein